LWWKVVVADILSIKAMKAMKACHHVQWSQTSHTNMELKIKDGRALLRCQQNKQPHVAYFNQPDDL
jgi:hypothetical protein